MSRKKKFIRKKMIRKDNYETKDRFAGISLPEGVISLDTAETVTS